MNSISQQLAKLNDTLALSQNDPSKYTNPFELARKLDPELSAIVLKWMQL